jgi:hypothetical protein
MLNITVNFGDTLQDSLASDCRKSYNNHMKVKEFSGQHYRKGEPGKGKGISAGMRHLLHSGIQRPAVCLMSV